LISNTTVQREIAKYLGMQSFLRRPVAPRPRPDATPLAAFDRIPSGDSVSISGEQDTPTIAVNPVDPNIVVVVGHNNQSSSGNTQDCSIYVSFDGGITYTYSADADLSVITALPHFCSDPVARFSPDGNDLYIAYLVTQAGVAQAISIAHFNGFDPTATPTRLDSPVATAPDLLESPWIEVHTFDPNPFAIDTGAGYVYLTYLTQHPVGCDVTFARSSNRASSFDSPPMALATSDTCSVTTGRSLKGPRPAAGPQQQVLVCWFDAGIDLYSTASTADLANPNPPPLNKFNIACRSSNDRGLTFSGGVAPPEDNPPDPARWIYAAKNVANEVAYYIPPAAGHVNGLFKMANAQFPALTIDHLGNAHIVFSFNPTTNARGADQANIGYVKSTASAPTATVPTIYSKWSARSIVASGPGAQIFPTITAQKVWESPKPHIYVGWIDTAVSSKLGPANLNAVYEARYRMSATGGPSFGKTVVVTDHASLSDFTTIGDYIDSTANNGLFHIAWTDNRFAIDSGRSREHLFADSF
jgi:hypothetical protein